MGQATPLPRKRPVALVVEDDELQRELMVTLLEESEMRVVECESGEAAEAAMRELGDEITLLFTDVKLAGNMSGVELAALAKRRHPEMLVIVTSGSECSDLPPDTLFMQKPWAALDVLIHAEKSFSAL
jgi:DNA-binding NtrC family response regulator